MKTALAVIDVQSYFLRRSPKDLPAKIAAHIDHQNYDCVAFVVFYNSDGSNYEKSLHWAKSKSPADLALPPEFDGLANKDNVFKKQAYSAFAAKGFEEYLCKHQIIRLDICGIDTDACVLATAFDAFDKNYEVRVLFDLCFSRYGLQTPTEEIILKNLQTKNS